MSVTPTAAGARTARELLAARAAPLSDVVGVLDERDRKKLADLLAKLLTRLYGEVGDAH